MKPVREVVLSRRETRELLRGCTRRARVVVTVWSDGSVSLRWTVGKPNDEERAEHREVVLRTALVASQPVGPLQ